MSLDRFIINWSIVSAGEKAAESMGMLGDRRPLPRVGRRRHLGKQAARHMRLFGQLSDQAAFLSKRARLAQQVRAWAEHEDRTPVYTACI